MHLEKDESLSWRPLAERYVAGVNVTKMVEMSSTWNWTGSNKMVMTLHEKEPLALQKSLGDVKDLVAVHVSMNSYFYFICSQLDSPRPGWSSRTRYHKKPYASTWMVFTFHLRGQLSVWPSPLGWCTQFLSEF